MHVPKIEVPQSFIDDHVKVCENKNTSKTSCAKRLYRFAKAIGVENPPLRHRDLPDPPEGEK